MEAIEFWSIIHRTLESYNSIYAVDRDRRRRRRRREFLLDVAAIADQTSEGLCDSRAELDCASSESDESIIGLARMRMQMRGHCELRSNLPRLPSHAYECVFWAAGSDLTIGDTDY